MTKGILGQKVGMTQVYSESGQAVPVTVVKAGPCHVLQLRTLDRDGYEAVQLGYRDKKVLDLVRVRPVVPSVVMSPISAASGLNAALLPAFKPPREPTANPSVSFGSFGAPPQDLRSAKC